MIKMVVGMNEVFDNFVRYLKKAYPDSHSIKLTFLEIKEISDTNYYRGQVNFIKNDVEEESTNAIFKANTDTGKIFYYHEGYSWTHTN